MRIALVALMLVVGAAVPALAEAPSSPTAVASVVGRVLTVDDAIAVALENQPQIQARLADYQAARFRVDSALAPLLPQLTGSGTTTKSHVVQPSSTGITPVVVLNRDFPTTLNTSVQLSQLIFDFGKTYANVSAARKLADVALADIELQRQVIVQAVRTQYTNINFAQRLIRVSQQSLDRAQLNLRSAQGGYEVGTRPKSDVVRAEVDVANANVSIIQARNAEQLARVALNTAMGLPADTSLQIRDNLIYEPVSLDLAQLRTTALDGRPELRQAKLRVQAAEASLRQATLNFLPNITGSGIYGGQTTSLNETWAATLSFSWTLFDGGGLIATYRENKAKVESARATLRAAQLTIDQDISQAFLTVREADQRIQAAQKAVESAQENFRLAQGRFDAGVGTILELTDAQLALTQTQNTEAQALADYRNGLANLERAAGRR